MTRRRWPYVLPVALVAAAIGVVACSDLGPTEPAASAPSPALAVTTTSRGFTRCTPQPNAQASAYIGSAGGKLKAGFGTITIGAGALSTTTLITLQAVSDTINSVRLSPQGLVFRPGSSVTLTISTKNCPGPTDKAQNIVYVTESLNAISTLSSVFDSLSASVSSPLQHFSRYAVHH